MIPIFRALWTGANALRRPPLEPFEESVLRLRVLPNDLDYNLHVNNGRYLMLMDLGRLDLVVRLGIIGELRRRRWNPFERSGATVAHGLVRSAILGPQGRVLPIDLVAALAPGVESPPLPDAVQAWREAEATLGGRAEAVTVG